MRKTVSVGLSPEHVRRLQTVAEETKRRQYGLPVSQSAILRVIVERGIEVVERELGIWPLRLEGE